MDVTEREVLRTRLCTKTLMVSVERSVQYRERSDRMAHSTLGLNSDGWFVECAIRSLRSRYCTVGMLLFAKLMTCVILGWFKMFAAVLGSSMFAYCARLPKFLYRKK